MVHLTTAKRKDRTHEKTRADQPPAGEGRLKDVVGRRYLDTYLRYFGDDGRRMSNGYRFVQTDHPVKVHQHLGRRPLVYRCTVISWRLRSCILGAEDAQHKASSTDRENSRRDLPGGPHANGHHLRLDHLRLRITHLAHFASGSNIQAFRARTCNTGNRCMPQNHNRD